MVSQGSPAGPRPRSFAPQNKREVPRVAVAAATARAVETSAPLLKVSGLARSFGSLSVLENINLEIRPGELVSIVGPNGAGKTTLIRCLSDGSEPFKGVVEIAGKPIKSLTPDRVVALGVGRKFQVASIFESLTVAECLRLARTTAETPSGIRSAPVLSLPVASVEILTAHRPHRPDRLASRAFFRTA